MGVEICGAEFGSWEEWLEYVSQPIPKDNSTIIIGGWQHREDWDSSVTGDFNFTRTYNYNEAMKLAQEGWFDAEADARKISKVLFDRIGALVERDEELYDVEGAALDVGAYLQGIPECFVRYEQHFTECPGPIVRIVFNITASAGISASTMIAKGAAIAGMIECIELSGKTTELYVCVCHNDGYGYSKHRAIAVVKIKDAGQPLDLSRVMFAMGHPSSFRRLFFRWLELQPVDVRKYFGSYGYPADIDKKDLPEDMHHILGDLYIGKSMLGEPQWMDEQSTVEWVIKQLRKFNIRVNDATVPEEELA